MKLNNIILLALAVVLFIFCYRFIVSYLIIGFTVLIVCAVLGHLISANTFRFHAKNPLYTIAAWPLVVIDLIKSYI